MNATTPGPRGSVEFLVRRDWAEKALKPQAKRWDQATAASVRLATQQRRKRLDAWRRDRAAHSEANDRTVQWIDRELARTAGGALPKSVLMSVRLPRSEVRDLDRRPAGIERLLRLAWLCNFPDPETMPLDELRDALEARGYALDAGGRSQPVALDALLPPHPSPSRCGSPGAPPPSFRSIPTCDSCVFRTRFSLTPAPAACRGASASRPRCPSSSACSIPTEASRLILCFRSSKPSPTGAGLAPS